jgi:hypothetical protein
MDHDANERRKVRLKPRQHFGDSLYPSGGRTDDDDVARNPIRIDRRTHLENVPPDLNLFPENWST